FLKPMMIAEIDATSSSLGGLQRCQGSNSTFSATSPVALERRVFPILAVQAAMTLGQIATELAEGHNSWQFTRNSNLVAHRVQFDAVPNSSPNFHHSSLRRSAPR
ncbi:hypothetical protein, partial [Methylocystis suflitae]|uniref:hypothetical protein n=1 Tax=Methylocystis suflitae TaxID=2951405 RepID=UPI00210A665B